MNRAVAILCCCAGLAVASCGRYGPPVRPRPASAPAAAPQPAPADEEPASEKQTEIKY